MDFIPSITTYQIQISWLFTSFMTSHEEYDAVKVFTSAKARIGNKKLRLTGIDRTPACENIVVKETGEDIENCKLQAGTAYTYSYDMEILDRYPAVRPHNCFWKFT